MSIFIRQEQKLQLYITIR